jgi:hypothetical protein
MMMFYKELGKVFWAVAAADSKIRKAEIEKLKELVRKYWLPLDEYIDNFGTNAAYEIEIVFDWLLENEWDVEDVILEFRVFHMEHAVLFTEEINELILKTVHSIAGAFSGENKSEVVLISRLTAILNKQE